MSKTPSFFRTWLGAVHVAVAFAFAGCVLGGVARADATIEPPQVLLIEGNAATAWSAPIAFSPDGKWLAASWNSGVAVFEAKDGKPHGLCKGDRLLESLQFYPNSKVVFGPYYSQRNMPRWDPNSGRLLDTIQLDPPDDRQLAMSPKGDVFAVANTKNDGVNGWVELSLIEVETGKEIRKTKLEALTAEDLVFHPSDGSLLAVSRDDRIFVIKTSDLSVVKELDKDDGSPEKLAFSPDGKRIAAIYFHGSVKVWDIAAGDLAKGYTEDDLDNEQTSYNDLAFSPDGKLIAVGGGQKLHRDEPFLALVRAKTGEIVTSLSEHMPGRVDHVAFSPDGTKLAATCLGESAIRVWDVSAFSGRAVVPEAPADGPRTWTSVDGKFTIVAELIGQNADAVQLKRPDGEVVAVPKSKLSEADLTYLSEKLDD